MSDIRFCKRCLYGTTHPLGLTLDAEGICSGCRVHEEKDRLDWAKRWRKLETIVEPYRSRSGATYDCIVPVTGANDSYFIVHLVKERLGLNPLLVTYNKYFNTPLGIRNLGHLPGRAAERRALLRQIAGGTWGSAYRDVRVKARILLGHEER